MIRERGLLNTALAVMTTFASALTAHAADGDVQSSGIGDPRVGGIAAYGPVGGLRLSTTGGVSTAPTWRVGYRFADRWWAGLHMETESRVPGLGLVREGLATLSGQYDFAGAYGLKPYVGAAASFWTQPTKSGLIEPAPLGAWLRLGLDYRLTAGLHSYVEVDGAYLKRGWDDAQSRQNVVDPGMRDTLQWRTGLLYRF